MRHSVGAVVDCAPGRFRILRERAPLPPPGRVSKWNRKLRHQIAGLRRQRYGVSSESLDQLELALEGEEVARAATPVSERHVRKTQPRRRALPEHLPREETVLNPGNDAPIAVGV